MISGRRKAVFPFHEVFAATCATKRMTIKLVEELIDEAGLEGVVAWTNEERTAVKFKGDRQIVKVERK